MADSIFILALSTLPGAMDAACSLRKLYTEPLGGVEHGLLQPALQMDSKVSFGG